MMRICRMCLMIVESRLGWIDSWTLHESLMANCVTNKTLDFSEIQKSPSDDPQDGQQQLDLGRPEG